MVNMLQMPGEGSIFQRLKYVNWGLIFLVTTLASVGFAALYSAAGGNFDPWASKQMIRYSVFTVGMIIIALIDIRFWYKAAYPFYFICLALLLVVDVMGHIGMGAQRWINLGFIQIQPSELTKIAVVMALSRYFHSATAEDMKSFRFLLIGVSFLVAPFLLVATQPDLGTASVIVMAGIAMFFLAGAPMWLFLVGAAGAAAAAPVGWLLLHDYQKKTRSDLHGP